jgi:broad specificity phosphatase PhoE
MYFLLMLSIQYYSLFIINPMFSRCRIMPHTIRNMSSHNFSSTSVISSKELWILRHGQAVHNPRAEAARERGCSHEEFMEWMKLDDCLDAPLTETGRQQIQQSCTYYNFVVKQQQQQWEEEEHHWFVTHPMMNRHPHPTTTTNHSRINGNNSISSNSNNTPHRLMIVSSPLSRAIETADLAVCPRTFPHIPRICYEGFREINGYLQNAKRRTKTELELLFPHWNFEQLQSEHDDTWTPDQLESESACAERGYQGLQWLLFQQQQQPQQYHDKILLVAHGGILRFMFQHPHVQLVDGRTRNTHFSDQNHNNHNASSKQPRKVQDRFANGELRRYVLSYSTSTASDSLSSPDDKHPMAMVLTELDLETTTTTTHATEECATKEESNTMPSSSSSSSATAEAIQ